MKPILTQRSNGDIIVGYDTDKTHRIRLNFKLQKDRSQFIKMYKDDPDTVIKYLQLKMDEGLQNQVNVIHELCAIKEVSNAIPNKTI
jgi:hypothetical protein